MLLDCCELCQVDIKHHVRHLLRVEAELVPEDGRHCRFVDVAFGVGHLEEPLPQDNVAVRAPDLSNPVMHNGLHRGQRGNRLEGPTRFVTADVAHRVRLLEALEHGFHLLILPQAPQEVVRVLGEFVVFAERRDAADRRRLDVAPHPRVRQRGPRVRDGLGVCVVGVRRDVQRVALHRQSTIRRRPMQDLVLVRLPSHLGLLGLELVRLAMHGAVRGVKTPDLLLSVDLGFFGLHLGLSVRQAALPHRPLQRALPDDLARMHIRCADRLGRRLRPVVRLRPVHPVERVVAFAEFTRRLREVLQEP
mmetsp:Transcript_19053/g.38489  ORF Transcript_19053/g.38489 Transcript_19053/m.38489 type:complete len:305 (+) Transcript_19053:360-1274(+)